MGTVTGLSALALLAVTSFLPRLAEAGVARLGLAALARAVTCCPLLATALAP